jgi:hypothetical protein
MSSRSAEGYYSDKSEQSQDDREKIDQNEVERTAYARSLEPLTLDVTDIPPIDLLAASPETENDDDLLSELDMTPHAEAESDADIMAALDASDPSDDYALDDPTPITPIATWLTDVQELARKHGPFAPWQIVKIICALNAVDDTAVETGMGR